MYVYKEEEKHSQLVQEDLAKRHPAGYQPSLRGECALLLAELQRAMRPDEVIVALQQRHVIVELLGIGRVKGCACAR